MHKTSFGKKFDGKEFVGRVTPETFLESWLHTGGKPSDLLNDTATLIKSEGTTRSGIARLPLTNSSATYERDLFVKEYGLSRKLGTLKAKFGRYRVAKVWKVSWFLYTRRLHVPKPLGYFIYRRGPFWGKSVFCCEAVLDCENLMTAAIQNPQLVDKFVSTGLLETIVQGIAALHDAEVFHGDLKWSNILVNLKRQEFWFIDLDASDYRVRFHKEKFLASDLARFLVGGIEAGLPQKQCRELLRQYAKCRKMSYNYLRNIVSSSFDKLIRKKQSKLSGVVL